MPVNSPYLVCSALPTVTLFAGTVTAASDWDAPHRAMRVNPLRPDTYERAFYDTEMRDFAVFSEDAEVARVLAVGGKAKT